MWMTGASPVTPSELLDELEELLEMLDELLLEELVEEVSGSEPPQAAKPVLTINASRICLMFMGESQIVLLGIRGGPGGSGPPLYLVLIAPVECLRK